VSEVTEPPTGASTAAPAERPAGRALVPPSVPRAEDRAARARRQVAEAEASATPYRIRVAGAPPPLTPRPWRAAKVALGIVLLVSVALAALVAAIGTLRGVVGTGQDDDLAAYIGGDVGVVVEPTDGEFRVELPGPATQGVEPVPGSDGDQLAPRVSAELEGVTFSVTWFDLPGDDPVTDPAAVLSLLAATTADDLGGAVDDLGMQATGALPTHDFAVRPGERTVLVRHVIVDRTVHQLRVEASSLREGAFARFVDSLELLAEGEDPDEPGTAP
jgi:hypothetical protein